MQSNEILRKYILRLNWKKIKEFMTMKSIKRRRKETLKIHEARTSTKLHKMNATQSGKLIHQKGGPIQKIKEKRATFILTINLKKIK